MKDVRMLASKYEGKVCVQCMHGHEYVAPMVKERKILNGSGIDGLYGAYRQFAFNGSRKDKATFDAERQKHLDNPNDDAMEYQRQCYAAQGVKVLYPYRQPNIIQAVMAMSWKEINKPRLKYAIVKDYPEFKMFDRYWRARGSQQIVAGTRELHDKILATPLNVKGWKTPTPIYDRIYRGEL
jgi:asparagine synthetase B (glutamine-hydrolysing)